MTVDDRKEVLYTISHLQDTLLLCSIRWLEPVVMSLFPGEIRHSLPSGVTTVWVPDRGGCHLGNKHIKGQIYLLQSSATHRFSSPHSTMFKLQLNLTVIFVLLPFFLSSSIRCPPLPGPWAMTGSWPSASRFSSSGTLTFLL